MKILKINKDLFDLVKAGSKKFEVRKINKDYIKVKDEVILVATDLSEIYGNVKVTSKWLMKRVSVIRFLIKHGETEALKFLKNNYKDQGLLLIFGIEYYEPPQAGM